MSNKNSELNNFLAGLSLGAAIGALIFTWGRIYTNNDDYIISQCVELKKSLEEQLADTSKKDDLQRKLEQLKNWESEK